MGEDDDEEAQPFVNPVLENDPDLDVVREAIGAVKEKNQYWLYEGKRDKLLDWIEKQHQARGISRPRVQTALPPHFTPERVEDLTVEAQAQAAASE